MGNVNKTDVSTKIERKNMYRILIVDDEFLVRLGLKTTIDWKANGYEVVGEASNGREALEMVKILKPDIVLVDIKMPIMDGLEFITEVRKTNRTLSFIILSNYESFAYAKRAMVLGVSQYLLKSEINEEVLLASLESVNLKRRVEEKKSGYIWQEKAAYLSNNLSKSQINRCVPLERMEEPKKGLFNNSPYVVIKYFCNIGSMNEPTIDMLSKTMVAYVESEFSGAIYHEIIYQMHYYITLIFSVKNQSDITRMFLERSQIINKKLENYFPVKLRGGISNSMDAKFLPQMLRQAEQARQNCFFGDEQFVIYDEGFQISLEHMEKIHVSNAQITKYLKEGDRQGIQLYVEKIFLLLKQHMKYSDARYSFIDFLSSAKQYLETLPISSKDALMKKMDYDSWNFITSIEEAENYIIDLFDTLMRNEHEEESGYSASVKKSIAFIEENYHMNITLQDVAEYVAISKNYLSMLFKQETGINFVTYLNQYRIQKAKQLLTTTNMKIYEIADSIGFYSPYYFSKIFKEVTKMQCKEYRDKYSLTQNPEND